MKVKLTLKLLRESAIDFSPFFYRFNNFFPFFFQILVHGDSRHFKKIAEIRVRTINSLCCADNYKPKIRLGILKVDQVNRYAELTGQIDFMVE